MNNFKNFVVKMNTECQEIVENEKFTCKIGRKRMYKNESVKCGRFTNGKSFCKRHIRCNAYVEQGKDIWTGRKKKPRRCKKNRKDNLDFCHIHLKRFTAPETK